MASSCRLTSASHLLCSYSAATKFKHGRGFGESHVLLRRLCARLHMLSALELQSCFRRLWSRQAPTLRPLKSSRLSRWWGQLESDQSTHPRPGWRDHYRCRTGPVFSDFVVETVVVETSVSLCSIWDGAVEIQWKTIWVLRVTSFIKRCLRTRLNTLHPTAVSRKGFNRQQFRA